MKPMGGIQRIRRHKPYLEMGKSVIFLFFVKMTKEGGIFFKINDQKLKHAYHLSRTSIPWEYKPS